jgi:sarcosine oxidase, subunit alpha
MNSPYRLTPMDRWHQQRGAHMAEVSGWRCVVDYGDPEAEVAAIRSSVGLCDTTPLTKIDVQGSHSPRMLEDLGRIPDVGACAPAIRAQASRTSYIARLTQERFIVLGSPEDGAEIYKRLTDAAAGDACVHVTDVTSTYAVLQLAGPMSMKLLKKLSSVRIDSMATDRCVQGPLAGLRVLLIRRDLGGIPSWLLFVSRDFGEYAWECVFSAGHEFGIRPFGTVAGSTFTPAEAPDVSVI